MKLGKKLFVHKVGTEKKLAQHNYRGGLFIGGLPIGLLAEGDDSL